MEHNHTDTNRRWHIPSVIWLVGVGLLVALLAVVFFNVPVSSVVTWSIFIVLMFGSHFLHGGHGNHDSRHEQPNNPLSDTDNRAYDTQPVKDNRTNHPRGCH